MNFYKSFSTNLISFLNLTMHHYTLHKFSFEHIISSLDTVKMSSTHGYKSFSPCTHLLNYISWTYHSHMWAHVEAMFTSPSATGRVKEDQTEDRTTAWLAADGIHPLYVTGLWGLISLSLAKGEIIRVCMCSLGLNINFVCVTS